MTKTITEAERGGKKGKTAGNAGRPSRAPRRQASPASDAAEPAAGPADPLPAGETGAGEGAAVAPRPRPKRARPAGKASPKPTAKAKPTAKPASKSKAKAAGRPRPQAVAHPAKRRFLRRLWSAAPPAIRTVTVLLLVGLLAIAANFTYQVVRKPAEMLFPVSGALKKTPTATWREYGPLFREYSTRAVSPELLAALAQVEGAGDPVAHTYWRWQRTLDPFSIYKPASSAVGMYQLTDAAFADARRYCIRHHQVVADGPWDDWNSCWFNRFYTRVIPSHAIELTAVSLDRQVHALLAARPGAGPEQMEDLAALIHLCGAGPARAYVRHGFRLSRAERCGDHAAADYVDRVNAIKIVFRRLAAKP